MVVPISRMTRALSLVILATESSAFGLQSLHPLSSSWFNTVNRPSRVAQSAVLRVQHQRVRASIPRRPWSRAASPCRRGAPGSFPFMVAESDESAEGVRAKVCAADIAQTQGGGEGKDATSQNGHNSLEAAFGAGKGKHAGKKRRRHSNKYSSQSKTAEIDPWEEQLQQADKTLGEAEARARKELEELEERRDQRRLERGEVDYPDEEDIDPYDPSTFGYIEVAQVQGAHGIKGEVKVRSCSDFAVKRLCTKGVKYVKAPNRRFPRDVELIGGRWQKDDIFLLQFEGVGTRDAAAALRGHKVYVLEDEEVDLEENEYMVRDLVGARAYRMDDESVYLGEVVGVVLGDDLSSTVGLASDMLELRLPLDKPTDVPKECYIPFVPALVPVVSVNAGNCTVLMDLPDGLLELAEEVEEKVVIKGLLEG